MPVEFDDRGLNVIGNNVKAISFYDDARTLRAQIYLDANNALNISTTVITSTTSPSGTPAGVESAAFLTLAADGTLLGERVFTPGSGLTAVDGGPGGAYSLAVDTTIPRNTRQIISGAGLTGGGDLSADRTLAVGAGAGISVAADAVAIDTTAGLTWTGAHIFQGSLSTRTILPEATDTYDLGSSTKLWRKGWLAELDAVVFAQNTITLLGGWLLVTKNEVTLPADVTAGATTINFGTSMTVGDFVLFRAAGAVEYVSVGTLVSGTTYNVTRNLDGSGANAWAAGTPGAVLGQTGNGRIELNAYDTPRVSIIKQGATYNAQTEVIRLGDLNGSFGIATEIYGIGIGDYSAGNYLRYDPTNGFVLKGGANNVTLDSTGIEIVAPTSEAALNAYKFKNGSTSNASGFYGYGDASNNGAGVLVNSITSKNSYVSIVATSPAATTAQAYVAASNTSRSATITLTADASRTIDISSTNTNISGTVNATGGLNVGSATGAATGEIKASASIRQSTAITARAYNSAAISISTATWTLVTYDSERFDTDGIHSTSSNTSRLTASVAGHYIISWTGQFATNATGIRGAMIRLNSSGAAGSGVPIASVLHDASSAASTNLTVTTVYDMGAGDHVEAFVYQSSGGNLDLQAATANSPEFALARIA